MHKILEKEQLSEKIFLFEVEAPNIVKKARAGQFIIIRLHEKAERVPLTIADYSREKGSLVMIFQVAGASTRELARCEVGDNILDIVGPLGMPSEIEKLGTVVCVGGGVGIAPVYPIARALKDAGNRVISVIGSRSSELLFWVDKMDSVSDEIHVVTDDGSAGRKGFVTEALKDILNSEDVKCVWAVGPMIMMKNVALTTKPFNVKTVVSLNPIMVDGTGMCGACRVEVGGETKFACVHGPEFDAHQVDFELAMKRSSFFKDKEQEAEKSNNGGECRCR